MGKSDKCIGISRDIQCSRKPDRRDTNIAGFVFLRVPSIRRGLPRKRSEESCCQIGTLSLSRGFVFDTDQ